MKWKNTLSISTVTNKIRVCQRSAEIQLNMKALNCHAGGLPSLSIKIVNSQWELTGKTH